MARTKSATRKGPGVHHHQGEGMEKHHPKILTSGMRRRRIRMKHVVPAERR